MAALLVYLNICTSKATEYNSSHKHVHNNAAGISQYIQAQKQEGRGRQSIIRLKKNHNEVATACFQWIYILLHRDLEESERPRPSRNSSPAGANCRRRLAAFTRCASISFSACPVPATVKVIPFILLMFYFKKTINSVIG
jgi:hypothetical protein